VGDVDLDHLTAIAERLCSRNGWGTPRYIDNGASAAVYCIEANGKAEALKIYDPEFFKGANALIETKRIELQQQLIGHGCSHLVDVKEAGEIVEDRTWYLRMEFSPWDSLEKKLAYVPAEKVHALIKQLVLAVKFLEGRGLVHRDIKPANIVVSDDFNDLKLLDFGVLRRIAFDEGSGTEGHRFIATAQYSPPEFLSRYEEPGEEGFAAINVYQVGAVLHDLITKTPLFAEQKATQNKFILFKAVTEKRPRVMGDSVSPRLIALCGAALDKDPISRAKSVTLDDFLKDVDDIDAIRRRVARTPQGPVGRSQPSMAAWTTKVNSWGREAAGLEAETLGPFHFKPQKLQKNPGLPAGQRWILTFTSANAPIYLDLVPISDGLAVYVESAPSGERGLPVFVIDADGPGLPITGIPNALSAAYLFALDQAMTTKTASDAAEGDVA
jgi:serine/threonine protein kinase